MHHASQVAHRWPTTTLLGAPTVIGVATGAVGAVVPYQFNLSPPTPEGTPHVLSKPPFETVHVGPKVAPVAEATDAGNVAEVLLVIVVVFVIAGRVYVRLMDAAGNVLARADG